MKKNKRPQAKCLQKFEMSICGEYVYNMYVKESHQRSKVIIINSSVIGGGGKPSEKQSNNNKFLRYWGRGEAIREAK